MSLTANVRQELLIRKGQWPEISRQTGCSYSWITKFAQGRIRNPGAAALETLDEHFKVLANRSGSGLSA